MKGHEVNRFNRCHRSRKPHRFPAKLVSLASLPSVLVVTLLCSVLAEAATVRALQGQVLINAGQGYRLVDGSTILEPGATVVANPGAVAQVVYPGGCAVTVQPGSVYVIAAQAPCQKGEPAQPKGGLTENTDSTGGIGTGTAWALGIAAVGAGGAAVYFVMSASP
jgi:hypothetical protein